jgi:hypothetical protein
VLVELLTLSAENAGFWYGLGDELGIDQKLGRCRQSEMMSYASLSMVWQAFSLVSTQLLANDVLGGVAVCLAAWVGMRIKSTIARMLMDG